MTTRAPAKKAATKPAKKAAPPAARKTAAPRAPRPAPPDVDTTAAAPAPANGEISITFHGRTFPVIKPSQEQMALLIDIQNWVRKLKNLQADLEKLPEETPEDHPEVVRGQKAVEQALRKIGRMNTIVETLIPAEDWEEIQDGMAERQIPWQDFANMPYLILAAHNEAGVMVEANRAARRQQGRRAV